MMRTILLILFTLCLGFSDFSRALEHQSVQISVDDKTHQSINQVVFSFDKDIALNGAVPSLEQLQFFSVSKKVNKAAEFAPVCLWRFLDPQRLACELKEPMLGASIYVLEVKAGFEFLDGSSLSQGVVKEVKTDYPKLLLSSVGPYRVMELPSLFTSFVDLKVDLSVIAGHLRYRLPDGDFVDVTGVLNEFEQQKRLQIKFNPQLYGMQQGRYQLLLKAGFKLPYADYALEQDFTVFTHHFYNDFKFLGFSCGEHSTSVEVVELDADGLLDCEPSQIQLLFSRALKYDWAKEALTPLPIGYVSGMERDGLFVASIHLLGEREYTLDLNRVLSRQGDLVEHSDKVSFATIASKPAWQLMRDEVYEVGGAVKPTVAAQSIYQLSGRFMPITSADELLTWLNGQLEQKLVYFDDNWALDYKNRSDIKGFDIPYEQHLPNNRLSGLIDTQLSVFDQQKRHLLNLAGFHLSLWRSQDWLIYASDWQKQQPLLGVDFSLVCQSMSEPLVVGRTDDSGMLVLARKLLKSIQNDFIDDNPMQDCWLWGQVGELAGELTAAMKLPAYYFAQNARALDVVVKGWASQPVFQLGDKVQLGLLARQRSDNGVVALTDWDGRHLWVKQPFRRFKQKLASPKLSQFGFADLSIDTQGWLPGDYVVALENPNQGEIDDRDNVVVAFKLEQFTPPEYEVLLDSPRDVERGETVEVDIAANRLNGVALEGAKVSVTSTISDSRLGHDRWPQGFSWVNPVNQSKRRELPALKGLLDANGYYQWQMKGLNFDFAMAAIRLNVTVKAKDGEVQQHHHSLNYFAADHFIGLKWHENKRAFDLIAVDRQGQQVELSEVAVTFATRRGLSLPACEVKRLPATCEIAQKVVDAADNGVVFKLKTTERDYRTTFHRFHFRPTHQVNNQRTLQFAWQQQEVNAKLGEQLSATLISPVAGKVQLVLIAGGVKRYWLQDVVVGQNQIELDIDGALMPAATLHGMMLLPRGTGYRQRQASLKISVLQAQEPLQLTTELLHSPAHHAQWQSGETLEFIISSNKDVDSQSWLVSDALWQLLNVATEDFDLAKQLSLKEGGDRYLWTRHWFETMLGKLGHRYEVEPMSGGGRVMRLADGASMENFASSNYKMAKPASHNQSQGDFVQSVWLPLNSLKANKKQRLSLTLPKVPGRFKLVTIAGNDQQMTTQVDTVVTQLPQEFFLDAPKQMRIGDTSTFLLTSINRQAETIKTKLKILLNQQPFDSVNIRLAANQQKVKSYGLPELSVGEHLLQIEHSKLGIVAEQKIVVATNSDFMTQSWLYQAGQSASFVLPEHSHSLQLLMSAVDQLAPHWQKQMMFVKDYPHQCWEQNLSRAISYYFIPQHQQLWPQGEAFFQRLLAQHNQADDGAFGFFHGGGRDDFLTAYSYLAIQWLNEKDVNLSFNQQRLEQAVKDILTDQDKANAARSMALAGLSMSGQLKGDELLAARQSIGSSSGFALALQLLALKYASVDGKLQSQAAEQLLTHGYQDASVSILSDNAERCFAALALGKGHPSSEQLIATVRQEQWTIGGFGSTFAAGVCSYLLQDELGTNPQPQEVAYQLSGSQVDFKPKFSGNYWLQAQYRKNFAQMESVNQGMQIFRQYYLRAIVDDEPTWLPIKPEQQLNVGDVVRVELTVDSPLHHKHGVITDFVPGSFEVVNESFAHQVTDSPRVMVKGFENVRGPVHYVHKQIDTDKVRFYPQFIYQGEQNYSYLVKVRHIGEFIAPAAKVELMYNEDVKGRGDSMRVFVE